MNNDLNWGEDKRVWPRLARWVQRHFQTTCLPHTEPFSVILALPPLLIINIPLVWKPVAKLWDAKVPIHPVLHLRLGTRRDMNTGIYYPTTAAKEEERSKLW